jgi:hypothetical protein
MIPVKKPGAHFFAAKAGRKRSCPLNKIEQGGGSTEDKIIFAFAGAHCPPGRPGKIVISFRL